MTQAPLYHEPPTDERLADENAVLSEAVARPHSLRLVTLNTFGVPTRHTRARLRTLARELDGDHTDVVCLQEVQLSFYETLLRREFRSLAHAASKPHVYAPKGGLMTLTRSSHREIKFHPFRHRGLRFGPSVADWALYKGALVVELADHPTPTIVINTHLNANYDGDWSPRNRYARIEHSQIRQLIHLIGELDRDALIVIAGDFNFPRSCWLYNEFVSESGVIDPLATRQDPTFRPPALIPQHYAQAIDFVFVRPPYGKLLRARGEQLFEEQMDLINGRRAYLSDHHAIRVELAW